MPKPPPKKPTFRRRPGQGHRVEGLPDKLIGKVKSPPRKPRATPFPSDPLPHIVPLRMPHRGPRMFMAPPLTMPEPPPPPPEPPYRPTPAMRAFRVTACACVEKGEASALRWMAIHKEATGEIVNTLMFKTWKKDPAFCEWFYLPLTYEPDAHDQAIVDAIYHREQAKRVNSGDGAALELHARTTGKIKRAEPERSESVVDEALRQFLKAPATGESEETTAWSSANNNRK